MITAEDIRRLAIFPIKGPEDLSFVGLIVQLINLVFTLAGIIAFAYLIYAGILYITAAGKKEQIEKAQQALVSVVIGIIIIILSYFIIRLTILFITRLLG